MARLNRNRTIHVWSAPTTLNLTGGYQNLFSCGKCRFICIVIECGGFPIGHLVRKPKLLNCHHVKIWCNLLLLFTINWHAYMFAKQNMFASTSYPLIVCQCYQMFIKWLWKDLPASELSSSLKNVFMYMCKSNPIFAMFHIHTSTIYVEICKINFIFSPISI